MTKTNGYTVHLNGIDAYYELHGSGDPVLLLHGFGGTSGDWIHAGREVLSRELRLVCPDARGHGQSTNATGTLTHAQCAQDALVLLDHLEIERVKAIGISLGGNTLLHLATLAPDRVERMIVVSSTPYFPERARRIIAEAPTEAELAALRERHPRAGQVEALLTYRRAFKDDTTDMAFTPPALNRIQAETLVIAGDRDPLYSVGMALQMAESIPRAALWVVPGGGHGPIYLRAARVFVETATRFLAGGIEALARTDD